MPEVSPLGCSLCRMRLKTWSGDDPVCAFVRDTARWSPKNWNCATTNQVRALFERESWGAGRCLPPWIMLDRFEDVSLGVVNLRCLEGLDLPDWPIALVASWYKSRGRTDTLQLIYEDKPSRSPIERELLLIVDAASREPGYKRPRLQELLDG